MYLVFTINALKISPFLTLFFNLYSLYDVPVLVSPLEIILFVPWIICQKCTFGGSDLDVLFITTRGPDGGGLYSIKLPGIKGLPEPEFCINKEEWMIYNLWMNKRMKITYGHCHCVL